MTAKYRHKETGAWGITEAQIKAESNTSFPEKFRSPLHDLVFPVPKPACTILQQCIETAPKLTALGTWQQTWAIVNKFEIAEEEQEFLDNKLSKQKLNKQTANKKDCESFIISHYPEPIQRSAALGVYPSETVTAMTNHIASIIAEENRVFDLMEAATTIEELNEIESPVWPGV